MTAFFIEHLVAAFFIEHLVAASYYSLWTFAVLNFKSTSVFYDDEVF